MAKEILAGAKGFVYEWPKETLVVGDGLVELAPNKWHQIETVAPTASTLPTGMVVTQIFKTPDVASTPIVPAVGDTVYPLGSEINCNVDVNLTMDVGTIDVTTKCSDGFVDMIVDGFSTFSGDMSGFVSVDDITKAMTFNSEQLFKRFMDIVDDDSEGGYVVTGQENSVFNLAICFNSDAAIGEVQNWVIAPVNITSFGTGALLKDAVKSAVSFSKAPGKASKYNRIAAADDVIGAL